MKPSTHLIRFFVIAFFLFMIAGPVLYRCGVFKKQEQIVDQNYNYFAEIMTQPWFDSTAFRKLTVDQNTPKMYSSKSGPAFGSYPMDTLTALEVLEMRHGAPRMRAAEVAAFSATHKKLNNGQPRSFSILVNPVIQDSVSIYFYVMAGSDQLSRLTHAELKIVQAEIKRLSDNKLNSGKTPYLGLEDTLSALKFLRVEKLIRPVK